MNNVTFNFLNSNESFNLSFKNPKLNKNQFYNQPSLTKIEGTFKVKNLFKFNTSEKEINILERNIKESLLLHENFLNANLPSQVDIEIVRTKKTEQFEHFLRKDNKYYFKTIQELFITKQSKNRKNQQDKISGESIQKYVLKENTPKLRLAIDFAKEFDYKNPPIIFDKFLTELRKSIPNLVKNQNIIQSNKIITELIVLHELAHIILDKKINQTYFKAAYELKDEKYDGKSIKQFIRLIHENFADGMATYLVNIHYVDNDVAMHYKEARKATKNNTEGIHILNIYETINTINQMNDIKNLTQEYLVDTIFNISFENSLLQLDKKLKDSENFKLSFIKDLLYLNEKKCLNIDMSDIIDSLKKNIFEQLNNPLLIKQILLNEKIVESKKQVFKNMNILTNKFNIEKSNRNNFKI